MADAQSKAAFAELQARGKKLRGEGKLKSGNDKREWIRKEWAKMSDVPYVPRRKAWADSQTPAGMQTRSDLEEETELGKVGRAVPEKLPPTHAEKKAGKDG